MAIKLERLISELTTVFEDCLASGIEDPDVMLLVDENYNWTGNSSFSRVQFDEEDDIIYDEDQELVIVRGYKE